MKPGNIRAIALCIFLQNGKLLVGEGFDAIKQQTFNGEIGHETVLMYRGDFVARGYYQRPLIEGIENGTPFRAIWLPLADFAQGRIPLYPTGLLEMIQKEANL